MHFDTIKNIYTVIWRKTSMTLISPWKNDPEIFLSIIGLSFQEMKRKKYFLHIHTSTRYLDGPL